MRIIHTIDAHLGQKLQTQKGILLLNYRRNHYQKLINEGLSENEQKALDQLTQSFNVQSATAAFFFAAALIHNLSIVDTESAALALSSTGTGLQATSSAFAAQANILSMRASFERRAQE